MAIGAGLCGYFRSAPAVKQKRGFVRELVGIVVPALAVAVLIQTFLIKPFRIPSESMLPNLLVGDYLFVSKYSYGYSRYSFPLAPRLFSGRIFSSLPQRGDIVVFRLPLHDSEDYIKRVIGLPGDTVQMIGGVLHINGLPVARERVDDFVLAESGTAIRARRWRETLPNGVAHMTLDLIEGGPGDDTLIYRVPSAHYFMMGDNRDDSADSRMLSMVGYVPFENFVGRAEFIFFSVGSQAGAWEFWRWPWTIRRTRLFMALR